MIADQTFWFYRPKVKPKKTNITLAVDSSVVEELKKDAELFGVSLNAKIGTILSKHVVFYRHTEKQECSIIPSTVWGTIVDLVEEEKLSKILEQETSSLYAILLHNNIPMTLESCIKYCFEGICLWSGMYCSFRTYKEDSKIAMVFEHKFGIKWSKALGVAFSNLIAMMHPWQVEFEAYTNTLKITVVLDHDPSLE